MQNAEVRVEDTLRLPRGDPQAIWGPTGRHPEANLRLPSGSPQATLRLRYSNIPRICRYEARRAVSARGYCGSPKTARLNVQNLRFGGSTGKARRMSADSTCRLDDSTVGQLHCNPSICSRPARIFYTAKAKSRQNHGGTELCGKQCWGTSPQ